MPNGKGPTDGFGAVGGPLPNGSPPQSIDAQSQESSPGVAAYPPMMVEKAEGSSADVTVHKGDALQSLKLSMPMQETELCKQK